MCSLSTTWLKDMIWSIWLTTREKERSSGPNWNISFSFHDKKTWLLRVCISWTGVSNGLLQFLTFAKCSYVHYYCALVPVCSVFSKYYNVEVLSETARHTNLSYKYTNALYSHGPSVWISIHRDTSTQLSNWLLYLEKGNCDKESEYFCYIFLAACEKRDRHAPRQRRSGLMTNMYNSLLCSLQPSSANCWVTYLSLICTRSLALVPPLCEYEWYSVAH